MREAVAMEVDDVEVGKQVVDEGRGYDLITEDVAPFVDGLLEVGL
jgi:hypothetical protein